MIKMTLWVLQSRNQSYELKMCIQIEKISPTSLRLDPLYTKVYLIYFNIFIHGLIPFILLIFFNISIYKQVSNNQMCVFIYLYKAACMMCMNEWVTHNLFVPLQKDKYSKWRYTNSKGTQKVWAWSKRIWAKNVMGAADSHWMTFMTYMAST